jgi:[protein-PII] uridylyltransferase
VNATPTPSEQLAAIRGDILARADLAPAGLRDALVTAYDSWLATRLSPGHGVALVASGSLGRREPAPWSDLDLVLLHTGRASGVAGLADDIWYPIWDSGVGLDHSVRTPDDALAAARDDLKALLGLLDVRHIAGDAELTERVRAAVLDLWRRTAPGRVHELRAMSDARARIAGDGAFLLEPNLKDSRGGLRDVVALVALARAQLVDLPSTVRAANLELLDLRGELHRSVGRADDVLRQQEHEGVARALGLAAADGSPQRDEVLRRANHAARTVAHNLDLCFRRITAPARRPPRRRLFGAPVTPARSGLARDVVEHDGEVALARDAAPGHDPGIILRAARVAAEHQLPFSAYTLQRLAAEIGSVPSPWPGELRADFVALLGTGSSGVPVLEALDLAGLLRVLIPEWDEVRCRAQHNPVHRYTVDRHLLETAAAASTHSRTVERPDLLLVGALLHDIGKGFVRTETDDHSIVGAEHARRIAGRMGFSDADVDVIAALARHHLLLPDTALRRDLADPATIRIVSDAVSGSAQVLTLLHRLAIADAHATGPAAWSEWKDGLIADLVARVESALGGAPVPDVTGLDDERRTLADRGELALIVRDRQIIVASPDRAGVLHQTAGVLALHMLDIRQASIRTHRGMAVNSFVVEPRFGRMPDPAIVRGDLVRAFAGGLPLAERLREKDRAYSFRPRQKPPTVMWFDGHATDASVLEIRTEDSIGLLTRITAALERCQLDVRSARVSSLGESVVDAFYLTDRSGQPVTDPVYRARIEAELRTI